MSQGTGQYNRAHDAEMTRQRNRETEMRRREEHQMWLANLTPEQRAAHDAERQRVLQQGRRQARIWAETSLRGRNIQNVVSDEDELERQQQPHQQTGGGIRKKKNAKRNTRKTKPTRKHKKTRRYRTKKYSAA